MTSKKLLISLAALVLIMAAGYAAFSTSLKVEGNTTIASSWNIHFDTNKTEAFTISGSADSTGSIQLDKTNAVISASLIKPRDKITFDLTIVNDGSVDAKIDSISLIGNNCSVEDLTCTSTSGHIKFTVADTKNTVISAGSNATFIVIAEWPDSDIEYSQSESASISITPIVTQA